MNNKVFFADDVTVDKEVAKLKESGLQVRMDFFSFGITIDYDSNSMIRTHIDYDKGIPMTVIYVFPILKEAIVNVYCGNAWQNNVKDFFEYYDKLGLA